MKNPAAFYDNPPRVEQCVDPVRVVGYCCRAKIYISPSSYFPDASFFLATVPVSTPFNA
jgi:hypothetical protein